MTSSFRGNRLYGTGINTDTQIGYHEMPRNSGTCILEEKGVNKNVHWDCCLISVKCFSRKKYLGGGGRNSVKNWGTTTRIFIIFGVPPHKYKCLK